nr:hypothetical protein UE_1418 [Ustilago esculenta]
MVRSVVVGLKVQKAENGTEKDQKRESIDSVTDESPVIARESRAAEEAHLETQSQSLIDKLLQLAETRLRHSLPQPSIRCNIAASLGTHSSGEHSSPTGCSNCSRPVQHQQGNPKDGQEFCLLSSNNLESADVGPLETPPTIVTQDDLPESVDEEHEEGLHGWPDPSAVECIQDDVRRLCLTDPKLEWLIASCVEQHLHSIAHN